MPEYSEERLNINGVETVVLTAGDGDPLVYFHGAGTVTGFDALLPLAERHQLIVPFHPGFGPSADDTTVDSIHDYRRHYLDVFDQLGIEEFSLIGHSLGGWLGSNFAADHPERVRRLVLVAPVGLRVREHPTVDIFTIPDEQVFGHLTEDPSIFDGHVPMPPTPEWLADRYRESTSAARLLWAAPYDLKIHRWLHRLSMPTLLLWGDHDKIVPVQQADVWAELIPGSTVHVLPGAGHLVFDETSEAAAVVDSFVAEGAPV